MDESELTQLIIQRLGDHVNRNDIILEVCQSSRLPWPRAEALVRRVELQHGEQISRRKSSFWLPTLLAWGLIWLAFVTWSGLRLYTLAQIRDWLPGAHTQTYTVTDKYITSSRRSVAYYVSWSPNKSRSADTQRVGVSSSRWHKIEVGDPIEVVYARGSGDMPYLRTFASDENLVLSTLLFIGAWVAAIFTVVGIMLRSHLAGSA